MVTWCNVPYKRRKTETKTTNRRSSLWENEDGVQTQDTRDKIANRKRINGRGGDPVVMHCPAAVEEAPNPEQRGECTHTANRS